MPPVGDTVDAVGSATSPAASAVLAQILAPGYGEYRVEVEVSMQGTAEPLNKNLLLTYGAATLAVPTEPGVNKHVFDRLTLAPTDNLVLSVIALATVGAIYEATITATRIG